MTAPPLLRAVLLGPEDRGRVLTLMKKFDCCNSEKNGGGLYKCSDLLSLCGKDLGSVKANIRLYKRLARKFRHFSPWNFALALDLVSSSFALVGYSDVSGVKLNISMEDFARLCKELVSYSDGSFYISFGTFGLHLMLNTRYGFLYRGRHKSELVSSYFNNKLNNAD